MDLLWVFEGAKQVRLLLLYEFRRHTDVKSGTSSKEGSDAQCLPSSPLRALSKKKWSEIPSGETSDRLVVLLTSLEAAGTIDREDVEHFDYVNLYEAFVSQLSYQVRSDLTKAKAALRDATSLEERAGSRSSSC